MGARARLAGGLLGLASLALATSSDLAAVRAATPGGELAILDGEWQAVGRARRRPDEGAVGLKCRLSTRADGQRFSMGGQCRALLLFVSRIETELQRRGDRYVGRFSGSPSGPATLAGRLRGDSLDLKVIWPTEVHGDRSARMTIQLLSEDAFRMVMRDRSPKTGQMVTMTDLHVSRAGPAD